MAEANLYRCMLCKVVACFSLPERGRFSVDAQGPKCPSCGLYRSLEVLDIDSNGAIHTRD